MHFDEIIGKKTLNLSLISFMANFMGDTLKGTKINLSDSLISSSATSSKMFSKILF